MAVDAAAAVGGWVGLATKMRARPASDPTPTLGRGGVTGISLQTVAGGGTSFV